MASGCPEFPGNHILFQFAFVKDVSDKLSDGLFTLTIQLSHLILSQPDRFILQTNINPDLAVRVLINEYFGVIHYSSLWIQLYAAVTWPFMSMGRSQSRRWVN